MEDDFDTIKSQLNNCCTKLLARYIDLNCKCLCAMLKKGIEAPDWEHVRIVYSITPI